MNVRCPRTVFAASPAVLAILFAACSAGSTPLPSLTPVPKEPPIAVQNPTATVPKLTPAQSARPSNTPTRVSTVPPQPTLGVDHVFIQLTDPLDEPEYYCLDVPGAGPGVRLESDLQAHTCKPIATAADELFTIDHPNPGQIYMEAYDLCVEAEGARNGSPLRLQACSTSLNQIFDFGDNLIRLSGRRIEDLCVAIAPGAGIPTGGPSHLRRALTLEGCDTIDPKLIRWSIGLFDY